MGIGGAGATATSLVAGAIVFVGTMFDSLLAVRDAVLAAFKSPFPDTASVGDTMEIESASSKDPLEPRLVSANADAALPKTGDGLAEDIDDMPRLGSACLAGELTIGSVSDNADAAIGLVDIHSTLETSRNDMVLGTALASGADTLWGKRSASESDLLVASKGRNAVISSSKWPGSTSHPN